MFSATSNELLFIIIVICIAQAIILSVICGKRNKIKKKYHGLIKDFQALQLSLRQTGNHKISNKATMYNYNKVISFTNDCDKDIALYNAIYKNLQKLMKEDKIYHDPRLTRDEVVSMLRTSRKIFLEALQYHINMTFTDYTNKFRLDEAVELLEKGEYTNETIAEEVGFGSVNTFYRQFRQKYSISPSEYRKALNENLMPSGY